MTLLRQIRNWLKCVALGLLFFSITATAGVMGAEATPLVSSAWLADHLTDDALVVLDIRPPREFEQAHIPGALQTDFPGRWMVERDGIPSRLPDIGDLEAYLTELGIDNESTVVIVPASISINDLSAATWLYWVFKYLGHDSVAILGGGWDEWLLNRLPEDDGPTTPTPAGRFVAAPRDEIIAGTDYVIDHLGGQAILVDARPERQYTGEVTVPGLTARAGHIPGAINVPNGGFYDSYNARFADQDTLEAQIPSALADRTAAVIVYCSIGQASSMSWFVFHELLGFENVRLYEASIAAWSRREDLPLVTGPAP
jgi:thiosulfate/3-mercaptopyruvate sulfurtransferase